ncbi:MAG TPA: MBL fold metallo-hydrolase, partial [Pirellulales bacterium]|nr:MBL fold metallo-hydrolase [Pirellulales bacterium]
MVNLTFHGAAETVTGSKYLLAADDAQVLVDCGLFQGLKELRLKNWQPPQFDVGKLACVVLTHAHIDHVGYLPRLVKLGFQRDVWCTPATRQLADVILYDAAFNQEEEAEYANRKKYSKHHPALPLYDDHDVERALKLLRPVERGQWFNPAGLIWCRYHDAGHLLGSAMIEVEVRQGSQPLRILFSGDVGRYDAPLYHDPAPPPECDYLICESTYGNREHEPERVLDQLAAVVQAAVARGGVMVMASFAVGRAQQLMYLLTVLAAQGRIPPLPIYLDSPMAVDATRIYSEHAGDLDLSESCLEGRPLPLDFHRVHLARTVAESKAINDVRGPAVIISSSGMMVGGRILHHLRQRLPHAENTIVLGGFMAAGTRGRQLQEGAKSLRIHGASVPVRAAMAEVSALSGHAGHSELLRWLAPLSPPRQIFLTHGELESARALAAELHAKRGWNTCVPRMYETVALAPYTQAELKA